MNWNEFHSQLDRLVNQFGEKAAGSEKAQILWNKFKNVEIDIFKFAVDHMIGSCRQAPIVSDFYDGISEAKKQAFSKAYIPPDDEDPPSAFDAADKAHMMQTIKARIRGQVSDADWEQFKTGINEQIENFKKNGGYGNDKTCKYWCENGWRLETKPGFVIAEAYECQCL